jgi:hypothetical protein
VEDTTPPSPAQSKITFPPIPASPQQLKKRFESNPDSSNSFIYLKQTNKKKT